MSEQDFNQKKRLKELVEKEKEWFEDNHNKIKRLARTIPILVLGDYPKDENERDIVKEVIDKLKQEFHFAVPLKEVSETGNHLFSEKRAIKHYPIVIKLEKKEVGRPGAIGESILISCDKESQEKTFLFVMETPNILNNVFLIEHYFLYFPRTYFCKDDSDMINKAVKIAVRESYRLVYTFENDQNVYKIQ